MIIDLQLGDRNSASLTLARRPIQALEAAVPRADTIPRCLEDLRKTLNFGFDPPRAKLFLEAGVTRVGRYGLGKIVWQHNECRTTIRASALLTRLRLL